MRDITGYYQQMLNELKAELLEPPECRINGFADSWANTLLDIETLPQSLLNEPPYI